MSRYSRATEHDTVTTATYALFHLDPQGEPVPFYVGESTDPGRRFRQHQRDCRDPLTEKEAYVYLRDLSFPEFHYEVMHGMTEAEAVERLTKAGFTLYNGNRGIAVTTKVKRKESEWSRINREAMERVERAERRTVLHNSAQQLTKSEIVRQRINGAELDVDVLDGLTWTECPIELIPRQRKLPKKPEECRAEYVKYGDINIYVGWRNNGKNATHYARDTANYKESTRQLTWSDKPRTRREVLQHLVWCSKRDGFWLSY